MDLFQNTFGFLTSSKKTESPPISPKKSGFTPPTLENALSKGMITDHAMLWIRTLTKQAQNQPEKYIANQVTEITFKRTEYNQTVVIRDALLKNVVGGK